MMARIRIRVRDNNNIPKLTRLLKDLKKYRLEVGVFGDGKDPDYAMIASVHEFGMVINTKKATINIPERSFIRSTFDEKENEWYEFFKRQIKKAIISDSDAESVLGLLGERMVKDIRAKIRDLKDPPNAPSTIAAKKSSNPLIATTGLRQRITYRVVSV